MKITTQVCLFVAASLSVLSLTGCASESAKEAKLEARAKVSKADATKTAQAKVPTGSLKEGEIEEEKGKLIWTFDFNTPDTKDITEVNVDALTGEVVSVEHEAANGATKKTD